MAAEIRTLLALVAIASGVVALPACERSVERPRHVLLITVDTLRADHVADAGLYPEPPMPFVEGLLARGTRFTQAWSPIPRTTQALASLLTGLYPQRTGVRFLTDRLPDSRETLAEMSRRAGYRTIAVVSNHLLTRKRGLDRGFDVYDAAGDGRGADATTAAALAHWQALPPDAAVLLWVHYIDPHVPYHPPRPLAESFDPGYRGPYQTAFGSLLGGVGDEAYPADLGKRRAVFENPLSERVNRHVRSLYAADVRFTDDAIAALVAGLEARSGVPWLTVFTADHGESLGEHAYYYDHGDYVYAGTLRVPLGFVLPGAAGAGAPGSVPATVSLVDVTPTLVELLRLAPSRGGGFDGRSLAPYLRGATLPPRPVFAECGHSYFPQMIAERVSFDVAGRFRTVVDGRYKLNWTPGAPPGRDQRLFDLEADPGEVSDLAASDPKRAAELRAQLEAWTADAGPSASGPGAASDEEALRALGYVAE